MKETNILTNILYNKLIGYKSIQTVFQEHFISFRVKLSFH